MDYQPAFPFVNSNNPEVPNPNIANNPWIETPPRTMPWTQVKRPELVRFGESSVRNNTWDLPQTTFGFSKRKCNYDFDPKPAKMHITEEKMAAQLKNMHISNSYVNNQGFSNSLDDNECLLPTLVLSKEVQNLPTFQDSILPGSLLPKYDKPTRALVLWRPPAGSVRSVHISRLESESKPEDQVDKTNNNSGTPDLNSAALPAGFPSMSTEMEL